MPLKQQMLRKQQETRVAIASCCSHSLIFINQVFPDMMHLLKNVLSEFHFLFTGSGDSKKVRMTEKELG